jgi:hypothetical protein
MVLATLAGAGLQTTAWLKLVITHTLVGIKKHFIWLRMLG